MSHCGWQRNKFRSTVILGKQRIPAAAGGNEQSRAGMVVILHIRLVQHRVGFGNRQDDAFTAERVELACVNRDRVGL